MSRRSTSWESAAWGVFNLVAAGVCASRVFSAYEANQPGWVIVFGCLAFGSLVLAATHLVISVVRGGLR